MRNTGIVTLIVTSFFLLGPEYAYSDPVIEEVVVTARKRAESVMSIPQSVTAIDSTTVERAGLLDMTDIGHFVPNVNLTVRSDNEPNVVIRGVGAFGNTQGVGFYTDEAQMFLDQSSLLAEVERIEVIKGPVGTLYGGNNIGGAIKYVMIEPGEELGGYVQVEGGSFDTGRATAALDLPLIENKLYSRISLFGYETDGYLEDEFRNTDLNTKEEYGGRISIRWNATDTITVSNSFRYVTLEDGGFFQLQRPVTLGGFIDHTEFNERPVMERDLWSNVLGVEWSTQSGTISSITAYSERDVSDLLIDLDYSPAPILIASDGDIDSEADTFSQELRFTSELEGPFNFIAGLYYSDVDDRSILQNVNLSVGGFLIAPFFEFDTTDTQYAVFFNGDYEFGNFTFGFGARWNRAEADAEINNFGGQFSGKRSASDVLFTPAC